MAYKKISRFIKRVLLSLIIFLIVLGSIGTALFIVSQDKIQAAAISQVNKQLAVPVKVDEISLNVLHSFPSVSLVLSNVIIMGSSPELSSDTLFRAALVYIQFNPLKLLRGDYHLENISVDKAKAKLLVFENGKTNMKIWKEKEGTNSGSFVMDLSKLILDDVEFSYRNFKTNDFYAMFFHHIWMKANFSKASLNMDLSGDLRTQIIKTGSRSFLEKRFLQLDLKMSINQKEGRYSIHKGVISSGKLKMDIYGQLLLSDKQKQFDIMITSQKSPLQAYLNVIPKDIKSKIGDFTGTGDLSLDVSVKGYLDNEHLPEINVNYTLSDGMLESANNRIRLEGVELLGFYKSSVEGKPGKDQLQLNKFSARSLAGHIQGKLSVSDFDHPQIDLEFFSELDLEKLHDEIQINTVSHLKGDAELDFVFKGRINDIRKLTPQDFIGNTVSGAFRIQDSEFSIQESGLMYKNINGTMTLENNDIGIEKLSGEISKSDFELTGYFRNALSWIFIPGQDLIVDADFVSENLFLDELLMFLYIRPLSCFSSFKSPFTS